MHVWGYCDFKGSNDATLYNLKAITSKQIVYSVNLLRKPKT